MAKVTLELDIDWAMLKNQMNKLSKMSLIFPIIEKCLDKIKH